MKKYVVAALYKFVELPDYRQIRGPLIAACKENKIVGTLLLAQEGINGTIAGEKEGVYTILNYLKNDPRLCELEHKESFTDQLPFLRMKVKLKKEIVTLGVEGISPINKVGKYVKPKEWNSLIKDPEVVLIDTRNLYETAIGTFKGAISPNTTNFRDFPNYVDNHLDPKKHKKVAMCCTGGIRCEKSTALLLEKGFKEVYHLQGGILKYLEEVPEKESLWEGECFVFDERVAVTHKLKKGSYFQCFGCRHPISEEQIKKGPYKKGVYCPHCYGKKTKDQLGRYEQRQKQIDLAKQRGLAHRGQNQKKQLTIN